MARPTTQCSAPPHLQVLTGYRGRSAQENQTRLYSDLGALRTPFVRDKGGIDYRCPAEPVAMYQRKGGRAQNSEGRLCLCNGLLAAAIFAGYLLALAFIGYPGWFRLCYCVPESVIEGSRAAFLATMAAWR